MTDNTKIQNGAAASLQQIIEQEREKRIEAENFAKALVEEFTSCNDFDEVRQKFREKIRDVAPRALINIVDLADNAESESVKASMNKWILEWAMSDKIDGGDSELKNLLKGLEKVANS